MMTSDAKYQVYDALLDAIDAEYQQVRKMCANAAITEQPSMETLTQAVKNMTEYKQQLARLREIERLALGGD